jgi:sugar phosphate isomerase/epimerase
MTKRKFAVQIWPLRESFGQDMPATLERIAQIGYAGVELCRWFDWTDMFDKWGAQEIRAVCDQVGLEVVCSHISYRMIFPENLDELIRYCEIVGAHYAVVAAVPEELATSMTGVLGVAKKFNQAAVTLKSAGVRIGYHNHGFDFKPVDGGLPWEIFFDHTDAEVLMQIDIGNALRAGADPLYYLEKYPGRARLVHLKAYSSSGEDAATIGEDDVDWRRVFDLCERLHRTEWYIVEQETEGYDVWDSAQKSLDFLLSLD